MDTVCWCEEWPKKKTETRFLRTSAKPLDQPTLNPRQTPRQRISFIVEAHLSWGFCPLWYESWYYVAHIVFIIIFAFLFHDDPFTTLHISISSSKELTLPIAGVTFAVPHGLLLTLLVTERGQRASSAADCCNALIPPHLPGTPDNKLPKFSTPGFSRE